MVYEPVTWLGDEVELLVCDEEFLALRQML